LLDVLYHGKAEDTLIHQTVYAQPAIFSLEYALAELWKSWGIKPSLALGHSVGEYVAACIAGVFSLEDGLRLIAERGKLIQSLPENGMMAVVFGGYEKALHAIQSYQDTVSIAVVNSPENVVISGEKQAVRDILLSLEREGVRHHILPVSHAFHSPLMEPMLDKFRHIASGVKFSPPKIALISNGTGKRADGLQITTADYWVRHIRETVRFCDSIKTVWEEGHEVFLEIGPHSVLSGLGKRCIPEKKGLWLSSLERGEDDWKRMLSCLSQLYVYGMAVDWQGFGRPYHRRKVVLPNYPFQRKRYWKDAVSAKAHLLDPAHRNACNAAAPEEKLKVTLQDTGEPTKQEKARYMEKNESARKGHLSSLLINTIQRISGIENVDVHENLFKLGLSSIMITQLRQTIESDYDLEIQMSQFYGETDTVDKLAAYISQNKPETSVPPAQPTPAAAPSLEAFEAAREMVLSHVPDTGASPLENIIYQQIQLMSQQLEAVKAGSGAKTSLVNVKQEKFASTPSPQVLTPAAAPAPTEAVRPVLCSTGTVPGKVDNRYMKLTKDELTERQQAYVDEFIRLYVQRTGKSKDLMQKNRPYFSDWINALGFRLSLKEITYPIVSHRSNGPHLWDVDGNEYIDIAIGYGVNYLGHRVPFVEEAVANQLKEGFQLGPQFDLTGEVVELICEMTGVERVAFCNSGTEAIMTALRIARTVTGRDKIVIFENSYHGTFDGILAIASERGTIPASPGTPQKMVDDVLVLKYGSPESLEIIKTHGRELAAVLVEPVQSRNPGFQPAAFLRELREITRSTKTALIFDEIITGFRLCPGGAQAHYGIRADMVTYGKVIGGGMPIGVMAGTARFLDAIDGGMWDFGDASFPQKGVTFFGGTFCKHPLTMAAALATLKHLKKEGPALQESVNRRTAYFAQTLNTFFEQHHVPLRINYCASFFRFMSFGEYDASLQPISLDLLFYRMIYHGIYTWERRICFFSTVLTDEDVERVIQVVKESVEVLVREGFFPVPQSLLPLKKKCVIEKSPLSEAQRQLLALNEVNENGSLAYNLTTAIKIQGRPDMARVCASLEKVVARHEALRTRIEGDTQEIAPSLKISVPLIEVSGKAGVTEWFLKEGEIPFDLSVPPLFRASMLKIAEDGYLFVFVAHHTITDGLSMINIFKEWAFFYTGGDPYQLPPPMQFREFIDWQLGQRDSEKMARHESFWLKELEGEIPVTNLPADRPYPPEKTYKGAKQTVELDRETYHGLCNLGKEHGCTLFMTLMSVYSVLLHRLTGQEELIIGIPVSGRSGKGSDSLVGYCTHLLPIKSVLGGEPRFSDHLKHIRSSLARAYDHQDYPFARLLSKLDLSRDVRRPPLVSTLFNLDRAEALPDMPGVTLSYYPEPVHYTHYDMNLNVTEIGERLVIDIIYNTDIFEVGTIGRIQGQFCTLIKEILKAPDLPVTRIPLLTDAEKQLLIEWNQTETAYPKDRTIIDIFQAQAEKTPDAVAVVFEDQQLSYRELNENANQLAHYLITLGVRAETLVGICMERSLGMVVGLLGILKAGGAYMPLDPDYPAERLAFMLEDSRSPVLLCQSHLCGKIPAHQAKIVCMDSGWEAIADCSVANPSRQSGTENLAYMIYTSGSTGRPKGVLNTHSGIYNRLLWMQDAYQLTDADRVLQKTPFSFDVSVWEFFWPLITGCRLVVARPQGHKDAAYLVDLIARQQITTLHFVPSMLRAFLDVAGLEKCSALKRMFCSGEALPPDLVERYYRHFNAESLHNLYGPTEAAVDVSSWRCKPGSHSIPIGKPIANTQLYVLDKYLQPVPVGVTGELHIGGAQIARGYLNRPELTAERFIDAEVLGKRMRLYKTGDISRWLPDGNLEYLGRMDHQVKVRGFRIELGEIEATLAQHEAVREAVVALRNKEDNPGLAAYVVLKQSDAGTVSAIRDWVKSRLPDYMAPSSFTVLEKLPLTQSGKLDRNALPAPDSTAPAETHESPRTDTERLVVEAWEEVLKRQGIGIHDNFFALGGDSIKAILIVSRLNREGLKLNVRQVYDNPTVAQLASRAAKTERLSCQLAVSGEVPLTAIQSRFFSHHRGQKRQFCLAVLLGSNGNLDERIMSDVFEHIQIHHDALRMQYHFQGEKVIQENRDARVISRLEVVDLRGEADALEKLEGHCSRVSGSLYPEQGPLVKAVLFKMRDDDRFFIVAHHLVVDGVSWRILLEDVASAYKQRIQGKKIELPLKTESFKLWAEKIREYCNSESLLKEKTYWKRLETFGGKAIPVDFPSPTNLYADQAILSCKLTKEDTEAFLTKVNHAYHAEVSDILLTALARAIGNLYGEKSLLIGLEGHGRETPPASVFTNENHAGSFDVTRTVGWFTSIYPALLTLPDSGEIGVHIKHIKETLRKIPNKGFGYGIVKYLTAPENKKDVSFQTSPQIIFNYLGSFDGAIGGGIFKSVREFTKNTIHPELERTHALDIEGRIIDGMLELSIACNTRSYKQQTVEKLLQTFRDELQSIIAHCAARKITELTPSDLTYKALSQQELNTILSDYGIEKENLKDIYPLSTMQEGMLYHAVYENNPETFFEQFSFPIQGKLNVAIFESCWNERFKRYDIFRTIFAHKGLERPLQVVLREQRVDFVYEDVSSLSGDHQQAHIEKYEAENRRRGFDLSRDVLMRIRVFKRGEALYTVVWSYHHILLDGWSAAIIIKELFQAYEAMQKGTPPRLKPVTPYSRYIEWLERVDKGQAKTYWERYVSGYDRVATLPKDKGQGLSGHAYKLSSLLFEIPERLTGEFQTLATANHVSLNVVVQSVWGLLLCKYNNTGDVVLGSVVSGRPAGLPDVENTVGLFLNTIPVRIVARPEEFFRDVIKRVQKSALESEAFHYYPLVDIQSFSALKQELIDTVVVFENYPFSEELKKIGELFDVGFSIGTVKEFEQTNYNCVLEVYPGKNLVFELNYNGAVYREPLMNQIKEHFLRVLESVTQKPEITIRDVKALLMSEEEKKEQERFLRLTTKIDDNF
jgi:amino acid adenylation domain-containing protein/non-ribosomal peptide synthase protein (TIGR01720 family)